MLVTTDILSDIIGRQLVNKLNVAFFVVDEQMNVCESSCNLSTYGFPELKKGTSVDDQIDFMIGIDASTELDLPFVASPSGASISVSMIPVKDKLTVLISDATDATEQRRLLQQAANENELLAERQKKLMAQLEIASEQLEQKNQELEEASRLQTSFLSGVSHEFRTPLTSIIGYTNLVKNDLQKVAAGADKSLEAGENYLGAVQRSSKHLMSLVENLLDHGKFDADDIVLHPRSTLLNQIVSDVELVLLPLSETIGIEFSVDFPSEQKLQLMVDDSRLRQCLINLVGNAIKFTDDGSVKVVMKYAEDILDVTITDTGIGISQEDLEKIRLPFYQAADTGKVGTGLGLTITERIINMMGGSLDISSEIGKGTIVHFDLCAPLIIPQARTQADTDFECDGSTLHILLAEDDNDIAELVILMLSEQNVEVTHVANGALAVDSALNNHYDLILMDIHMPLMSGYDAIAELNEAGNNTPVVVMSASAVENDQRRAAELGCSAYLTKPVDAQEIIAMAKNLIP